MANHIENFAVRVKILLEAEKMEITGWYLPIYQYTSYTPKITHFVFFTISNITFRYIKILDCGNGSPSQWSDEKTMNEHQISSKRVKKCKMDMQKSIYNVIF